MMLLRLRGCERGELDKQIEGGERKREARGKFCWMEAGNLRDKKRSEETKMGVRFSFR